MRYKRRAPLIGCREYTALDNINLSVYIIQLIFIVFVVSLLFIWFIEVDCYCFLCFFAIELIMYKRSDILVRRRAVNV